MDKCAFVVFVLIFTIGSLFGQIVIDWTEIPQDLGTEFTHNGVDSVSVDLLSSGGPHAWQFTAQPTGPQNTEALVVPKASTPFGDSVPASNLVYRITEDSDTIYEYLEIAPTYGCNLGQGIISSVTVFFRFSPVDTNPFPVVYGANRNYHYGYTIDMGGGMELRVDDYGYESIDGWGTVAIPYGTFDCLRACQFDTIASTILLNGVPISGDTTNRIIHDFLIEDYGVAAHVLSNEDETNPNYTFASFLGRLTDFSSGILESDGVVRRDIRIRVEPNPFHDRITISLGGEPGHRGSGETQIGIYDISGRRVRNLVLYPSSFILETTWDGRDNDGKVVSQGIYFVGIGDSPKQKVVKIR